MKYLFCVTMAVIQTPEDCNMLTFAKIDSQDQMLDGMWH